MSYIATNPPWAGYTPPVDTYVLLNPENSLERYEFYYPPNFPWKPKKITPSKSSVSLGGSIWQYRLINHVEFALSLRGFPYDTEKEAEADETLLLKSIKNKLLPLLEKKITMIFVNPGTIYNGYFYVAELSDEYEINMLPGETLCDIDLTLRTTDY